MAKKPRLVWLPSPVALMSMVVLSLIISFTWHTPAAENNPMIEFERQLKVATEKHEVVSTNLHRMEGAALCRDAALELLSNDISVTFGDLDNLENFDQWEEWKRVTVYFEYSTRRSHHDAEMICQFTPTGLSVFSGALTPWPDGNQRSALFTLDEARQARLKSIVK